ncbi:hypothetical protein [Anaeroselena agilis]|uniref:Uncharacterized protein n=1 Tax=Anaeroselena agilis TaxID=3063788 RepID=A0ABU3NZF9_9FIRM|nr:hypothetical protein [Selenomonadales bacterium 4137-cl]
MCVADGALGIGLQVAGTVAQMRAVKSQAEAQARAKEYEAQMLERNAQMVDRQATDAVERGAVEEGKVRKYGADVKAAQRAAIGANGLLASGSALDILAGTNEEIELDAATVRANAQRERWGFDVQAGDLRNQAKLARYGAQSARAAGSWGAMTTLIGGATSVANKWYEMKKAGAKGGGG